jgi:hypothetical protein
MTTPNRLLLCAATAFVLATSFWVLPDGGSPPPDRASLNLGAVNEGESPLARSHEILDLPGLMAELRKKERDSDALTRQDEAILRRSAAKQDICRALAAQQLTLLEAAGRFRDLDESGAFFDWTIFCEAFPGKTAAERHCREAIRHTHEFLWDRPGEADVVCTCLDAELNRHLREGTLVLPPRRSVRAMASPAND